MHVMIDHVAAVIVGAVVLIAVIAMMATSNEGAVGAVQVDMGKTELRALVDALEQDLNNMGSGMASPNANAANAVVASYVQSAAGRTTLRFWSLQDDAASNAAPDTVTYHWLQSGTVTFTDGTSTPGYVVTRSQGGAHSRLGTTTAFSVKLLKDSPVLGITEVPLGSIPDSLALVRYVDVAVGLASPAGGEDLVQRTQWTKRFRPINLDNNRRQLIFAKPPGT